MTDKRRGWLAELKVGDLVIIEDPRNSSTVKKVDKITPTGRINIESYVFNQNGLAMGWDYSAPRLAQYSTEAHQEIKDYIKINALALELSSKNFKSLPLEKLVKIKEIIEWSGYE